MRLRAAAETIEFGRGVGRGVIHDYRLLSCVNGARIRFLDARNGELHAPTYLLPTHHHQSSNPESWLPTDSALPETCNCNASFHLRLAEVDMRPFTIAPDPAVTPQGSDYAE